MATWPANSTKWALSPKARQGRMPLILIKQQKRRQERYSKNSVLPPLVLAQATNSTAAQCRVIVGVPEPCGSLSHWDISH